MQPIREKKQKKKINFFDELEQDLYRIDRKVQSDETLSVFSSIPLKFII